MSSGRIARYRNYEDLMARHEHDLRIRKLSRLIVYILIIVILICSFLALVLIKQQEKKSPDNGKVPYTASVVHQSDDDHFTPAIADLIVFVS